MVRLLYALGLLVLTGSGSGAAQDPWAVLRVGGTVGLMRHGGAILAEPGTPPPVPGCVPSAVLTDIGREEMRRVGERMRHEGLDRVRIHVSRQCSAWETAKLLDVGQVQHEDALDPPAPAERSDSRRDALQRALLSAAALHGPDGPPVIFITHRTNIAAVTGIEVIQGEILLLRLLPSGGLSLVGRITAD